MTSVVSHGPIKKGHGDFCSLTRQIVRVHRTFSWRMESWLLLACLWAVAQASDGADLKSRVADSTAITVHLDNLQVSGSTTVATVTLLSGQQTDPVTLPYALLNNGGSYQAHFVSGNGIVEGYIVVFIQNHVRYLIQFQNAAQSRSVTLSQQSLSSATLGGTSAVNVRIQTLEVANTYRIAILFESLGKAEPPLSVP